MTIDLITTNVADFGQTVLPCIQKFSQLLDLVVFTLNLDSRNPSTLKQTSRLALESSLGYAITFPIL